MQDGLSNATDGWSQPRLGRLCEVAAAAISPGRRQPRSPSLRTAIPCAETRAGTPDKATNKFKVLEVAAFASVHDMIHAAIASYGTQATLREIYKACQQQGRIAYKRSGGSRLITHNDHWKSQIRHALYTCDRFARAEDAHDLWTVSASYRGQQPQTTSVLVRNDPSAACVNDDSAVPPRRPKQAQAKQAPAKKARTKHALDEPVIHPAPKQKRSRLTRAAARRPVEPALDSAEEEQSGAHQSFLDTPSGSVAVSNKPGHHALHSSDYSDMEEREASASAFQAYPYDTHTTSTPLLQHEGEDESSHNDTCVQVLPDIYAGGQVIYAASDAPVVYDSDQFMPNAPRMLHRGYSHVPVLDVHPYFTECLDAHQIVADSTAAAQPCTPIAPTQPASYRPMHLAHPSAPTQSKHSSDLDLNSSSCAGHNPVMQNTFGNSKHHNRLPPNQYVHLPLGLSPDHSNSQSPTPTQHMFAQCYSSPAQHPYLLYQPAAQYPSPGDRMRSGPRHIRRAPSVEAESPDELQVYSLRSRLAPRVAVEHTEAPAATSSHRTYSPGTASVPPRPQAACRQAPRSLYAPNSPLIKHQCSIMRSSSPLSSPSVNPRNPSNTGVLRPAASPSTNRTHLLLAAAQKAQADDFWPQVSVQTEQCELGSSDKAVSSNLCISKI